MTSTTTAHHEAAHGIVCEVLGGECTRLSIVSDITMNGSALLAFPPDLAKRATILLSGGVAQCRFLGQPLDGVPFASVKSDWLSAIRPFYESGWPLEAVKTVMTSCHGLAASYVNEHWAAIERLAARLMVARELDGSAVREVLRGAQADRKAAPRQRPIGERLNFSLAAGSVSGSPSTIDDLQRTVDAVWFSGSDVTRVDPSTDTTYSLHFDPAGVDLTRLNAKAPVLDSHNSEDLLSQVGVVLRAWQRDGKYFATLRFSRRPAMNSIWQDVKDGILSKFSMGVEILDTVDSLDQNGQLEVLTATKWRPYEISLLSVPADFGTTTLKAIPAQAKAVAPWLAAQLRQRQIDALRLG